MGIISVYIVHLANVAKLSTKCATNIEIKSWCVNNMKKTVLAITRAWLHAAFLVDSIFDV